MDDMQKQAPCKPQPFPLAAYLAELLGTFIIVNAIVAAGIAGLGPTLVGILGGLAAMGAIAGLGGYSGGYFHPVAALLGWWSRKMSIGTAVGYVIAEFIGGIAAAALQYWFAGGTVAGATTGLAGTAVDQPVLGAIIETAWTLVFLLVVGGVVLFQQKSKSGNVTPVIIGVALAGVIAGAGPYTGGNINPARELATLIFSNGAQSVLQFILNCVGQVIAGVLAALIYSALNA